MSIVALNISTIQRLVECHVLPILSLKLFQVPVLWRLVPSTQADSSNTCTRWSVGLLVTAGLGSVLAISESFLLNVVQLVDALLAGHELAHGRTDDCGANIVIATPWTPLLRRNDLQIAIECYARQVPSDQVLPWQCHICALLGPPCTPRMQRNL